MICTSAKDLWWKIDDVVHKQVYVLCRKYIPLEKNQWSSIAKVYAKKLFGLELWSLERKYGLSLFIKRAKLLKRPHASFNSYTLFSYFSTEKSLIVGHSSPLLQCDNFLVSNQLSIHWTKVKLWITIMYHSEKLGY